MDKAADILLKVTHLLGLNSNDSSMDFLQAWTDLVGMDLASHCQPEIIKKNKLVVRTDHPGWIQRFKMQERHILSQINQRYPDLEIQGFMFTTGAIEIKKVASAAQKQLKTLVDVPEEKIPPPEENQKKRSLPEELQGRLESFKHILEEREKD